MLRTFLAAVLSVCSVLAIVESLSTRKFDSRVSRDLFFELEELSRLTAISYCVAGTGIHHPFRCLSRCSDFSHVELVEVCSSKLTLHSPAKPLMQTFSTGLIDAKACGYIALSHAPSPKRIIVAFTGTQSLSDVISDMITLPAEYLPYPLDDARCNDCHVHAGFMSAWKATRSLIFHILKDLVGYYPDHELTLIGHSLGGAVAGLAALEFQDQGWSPRVTTFGEPRFANKALAQYVDEVFPWNVSEAETRYRRVTHVDDPVPLLPYEEWGWTMHGGEIFISKPGLPPEVADLKRCVGDEDPQCIQNDSTTEWWRWRIGIPERWRVWEFLFAHREYFWKLGFCFEPQWGGYPRPDDPPEVMLEL